MTGLQKNSLLHCQLLYIYNRLALLEGEILRAAESAAGDFPLVIIALGVAGRVLANHLLKRGFPGYLLDMDSLQEFPYDVPFSLRRFQLPRRMEKPLAGYGSADKLAVRWEGPLLGHYSYSIINRELCARLAKADGIDLSIRPGDTPFTDNPFTPSSSSSFRSIVERVGKHFPNGAHIHIGDPTLGLYEPARALGGLDPDADR
jgi:hypothetical protein